MQLRQMLYYCKSKSRTTDVAGPCTVNPIKTFENPMYLVTNDTLDGVRDINKVLSPTCTGSNGTRPAPLIKSDRVVDEICDHLLETFLIGLYPCQRVDLILQRRSEEHTSELQSGQYLVCRLL